MCVYFTELDLDNNELDLDNNELDLDNPLHKILK